MKHSIEVRSSQEKAQLVTTLEEAGLGLNADVTGEVAFAVTRDEGVVHAHYCSSVVYAQGNANCGDGHFCNAIHFPSDFGNEVYQRLLHADEESQEDGKIVAFAARIRIDDSGIHFDVDFSTLRIYRISIADIKSLTSKSGKYACRAILSARKEHFRLPAAIVADMPSEEPAAIAAA